MAKASCIAFICGMPNTHNHVRQESLEEEESIYVASHNRWRKPPEEPGGLNPTRQSGPAAGTECCVAQGRPCLRSVHRVSLGRVIEPRNEYESEADTVFKVEGSKVHAATPDVSLSAGSKSRAWLTRGFHRNLGDL